MRLCEGGKKVDQRSHLTHPQLEVPEAAAKKAGNDFTLSSQRKGFRRFHTEETKDLLRRQNEVIDTENAALAEVSRNMFVKFSAERVMWETVCHKVALVDALLSLCDYSFSSLDESQSCFPQFVPASATTKPFVKVRPFLSDLFGTFFYFCSFMANIHTNIIEKFY